MSIVILEPKKIKSITASTFSPLICYEVMALDLSFLNVEFQASFFLCPFTLIKGLFSFSSLSATRVVSSAYVRL